MMDMNTKEKSLRARLGDLSSEIETMLGSDEAKPVKDALSSLRTSLRKLSRNEEIVRSKAAEKKTEALASTMVEARARQQEIDQKKEIASEKDPSSGKIPLLTSSPKVADASAQEESKPHKRRPSKRARARYNKLRYANAPGSLSEIPAEHFLDHSPPDHRCPSCNHVWGGKAPAAKVSEEEKKAYSVGARCAGHRRACHNP